MKATKAPVRAAAPTRGSRGKTREGASFPVSPSSAGLPRDYAETLGEIKQRIQAERLRVVMAANAAMVLLYWDIGRMILERQERAGWGARVIDRLAADLHEAFSDMKGFSPRNLKYMRAFAAAWPERAIVQQLAAQIPWFHSCLLLDRVPEHPDASLKDETTGLNYKLSSGEKPVLAHNVSFRKETDGTLRYKFSAPTKGEAERFLRKNLPKRVKTVVKEFVGTERSGSQYRLNLCNVSLNDTTLLRGVAKIAACYARHMGFPVPYSAVAPQFVRAKRTPLIPVVTAISDVVAISGLGPQPLHHAVFLFKPSSTPQLIAYVKGDAEPLKSFLSTLPAATSLQELVRVGKLRWRIERDYQELKQEFGLDHFEGRSWRGFHHHATLSIAAYGFLLAERLALPKKTVQHPVLGEIPALPADFRPRGSPATPAPRSGFDRNPTSRTRRRSDRTTATLPVLRETN